MYAHTVTYLCLMILYAHDVSDCFSYHINKSKVERSSKSSKISYVCMYVCIYYIYFAIFLYFFKSSNLQLWDFLKLKISERKNL